MALEFWEGEYAIRINQIGALKNSDTIYIARADYFVDGTNVMDIELLSPDRWKDSLVVSKITHASLKDDSRKLTDKERIWTEKKLDRIGPPGSSTNPGPTGPA